MKTVHELIITGFSPLHVFYNFDLCNLEFGSERIPRSLLRGKRANDERYYSLRIEDSPQLAAESFNISEGKVIVAFSE